MKAVFKIAGFALVLALAFVFGFTSRDIWAQRMPSVTALRALIDPNSRAQQSPTELFQQQYNRILSETEVEVRPDKLKYAAMSGMFASLGDPHTNFLEPLDADSLKLETRGDFVGIGARLGGDPAGARIASVFRNSPAERAGLKVGDTIIEVNGQSTAGTDTDSIVKQIRGKEGSTVKLRVVRPKTSQPLSFTIRRATVVLPSVDGRMLADSQIGYISITGFAQPTPQQLDQALDDLMPQRPIGLVLDLRGNPGGLLDSAVKMLGRFVSGKQAVRTQKRGGEDETLFTPVGFERDIHVPIVILINEDSASAAEIFSGVLQEYKVATLVGEHSYGKSSVQNVINLIDFSSAKITIAKYFLPSGRDIGRKVDDDGEYVSGGLQPDVVVHPSPDEDTVFGEPAQDGQLRKAIEIIKSKNGRSGQASLTPYAHTGAG